MGFSKHEIRHERKLWKTINPTRIDLKTITIGLKKYIDTAIDRRGQLVNKHEKQKINL